MTESKIARIAAEIRSPCRSFSIKLASTGAEHQGHYTLIVFGSTIVLR